MGDPLISSPLPTTAWQAVARRLAVLTDLSDDETEFLEDAPIDIRWFAAGETIFTEGAAQECIYLCMAGWGAQFRMLPDGERQIVDLILPGCLFGQFASDDGIHVGAAEALIDLAAAILPTSFLGATGREQPRLAAAFALALGEESSRLAERVVSLGRRDAKMRLGHFFLELRHRLAPEGEAGGTQVRLPVPQREIADFLGLTPVHVSRTMRRMQDAGIIDYDGETVEILDPINLAIECDFDADRLTASQIPLTIRTALLARD
jgi:CRP-like cAMP-binding protein